MSDRILSESSFSHILNAPIEKVDIPAWLFSLPDAEFQRCSAAHVASGFTHSDDGKRMSIAVEQIGGSLVVQHYVEDLAQPDHLRVISISDSFAANGRTKVQVTWELSVKKIDDHSCEFTNFVHAEATDQFVAFMAERGIPLEEARRARQSASEAHNRDETPRYAKSIERHALSDH